MAYQQNQPQLPSNQQFGIERGIEQRVQRPQAPQYQQPQTQYQQPQTQYQQPQTQYQQPQTQYQQPPMMQQPDVQGYSAVASGPSASPPGSVRPTSQVGSVSGQPGLQPNVASPQSAMEASGQVPAYGIGQQMPQTRQQSLPQQEFGQVSAQGQPSGQFGWQSQRQPQGQFGQAPAPQVQIPQGQLSGMQGESPQTLGQQAPQQTQWGTSQTAGFGAPTAEQTSAGKSLQSSGQSFQSSGQSLQSGQSFQSGGQPTPAQMQEAGVDSVQQLDQQFAGTPSIDVVDTPDEVVLFVDLPGCEEEDIRIQADGQNLTISAERRKDQQEDGQTFVRERPTKLQRTVRLPARADVNEADATYEDGVCKITLPKMEEEKQHEIGFQ